MRKHVFMVPLILALIGLVVGCGKKANETTGDQAAAVQTEAGKMVEQAQEATDALSGRMKEAESAVEMATYTGTIGCGHCTYHVTDECSPCLQTADGTVYVIESEQDHDALMGDRFSGKEITVVGTVEPSDGAAILHASTVEIH
jgi:hypothetical protein